MGIIEPSFTPDARLVIPGAEITNDQIVNGAWVLDGPGVTTSVIDDGDSPTGQPYRRFSWTVDDRARLDIPINEAARGPMVGVWARVSGGSGANYQVVRVLTFYSNPVGGNKYQTQLGVHKNIAMLPTGRWEYYVVHKDDMINNLNPAPTLADTVQFSLAQGAAGPFPITLDILSVRYGWWAPPAFMLSFDDAYLSTYTEGFARAQAAGLPIVANVIPSQIGPGGLDWPHLEEILAAGGDVCMHTAPQFDGSVPLAEAVATMDHEVGLLDDRLPGWRRSPYHVWAGGYYDAGVAALLESRWGIVGARHSSNRVVSALQCEPYPQRGGIVPERFALRSNELNNNQFPGLTTGAEMSRILRTGGGCWIYNIHGITDSAGPFNTTPANYQALIDRLALEQRRKSLSVMTMRDFFR